VFTRAEELSEMSGDRSTTIQVVMTTADTRVSPVVDMQRTSMTLISNLIDKQDSAATSGFNVPVNFVNETSPNGSSLAKHITIPVELADMSVGLQIFVAANVPPEADFLMYYRASDGDTSLEGQDYILANPVKTLPKDTDPQVFREYQYLIGGKGGNMTPFRRFQLKLVMRSTNSAKVPVLRDLRSTALAV
jgi:hypothetical protein